MLKMLGFLVLLQESNKIKNKNVNMSSNINLFIKMYMYNFGLDWIAKSN